ncbi:MAG TPA: SIMPL domain-containing protein [Patescibacteria group bacterium]|nr:SIMPL domain-containing protein [Patescibacteria group bacterium]
MKDMQDMAEGGCACGGSCGSGTCCGGSCRGMKHGGRHFKMIFVCLALLALAAWLGLKARNEAKQFNYIGVPIERNVINVSGEGKVVAIPDIAAIDLGTTIERAAVAAAQKENTRVMNELLAKLAQNGVDKKDIQTTSYSVFPSYDWVDGKQRLRGYTVSQNVHVKIRDLDKVGDIIGQAGELGANQIGGIQFTVDDPEKLKDEARAKAIENAKTKAAQLSKVAGVKLVRVVSFNESSGGNPPPPIYYAKDVLGMGGAEAAPSPNVEAGSTEIIVDVSMAYEIE